MSRLNFIRFSIDFISIFLLFLVFFYSRVKQKCFSLSRRNAVSLHRAKKSRKSNKNILQNFPFQFDAMRCDGFVCMSCQESGDVHKKRLDVLGSLLMANGDSLCYSASFITMFHLLRPFFLHLRRFKTFKAFHIQGDSSNASNKSSPEIARNIKISHMKKLV